MSIELDRLKVLIVGAGFYGSVIAEHVARVLDERVVVIDKRLHIGGNCYSEVEPETGIEFHTYGTHIFHTANPEVWLYFQRFSSLNGYTHQVLARVADKVYQLPINLETINSFYGVNLRPFEVKEFLAEEIDKEPYPAPANLEEQAISMVGRPLYETFIKGYTEKQWGRTALELPASIIKRLPFRTNYNESYFFDSWQGIPTTGYAAIFEQMLDHPKIEVHLGVDFWDLKSAVPDSCLVIYSGAIDRFFHFKHGHLEYRSLRFEREVVPVHDFQGTSVINYPEADVSYTRIHEPRHLHLERSYPSDKTLIIREYSEGDNGENPYYPVRTPASMEMLARYQREAKDLENIVFGGRLGQYQYNDMDKTIAAAMEAFRTRVAPWCQRS